MRDREIDQLRQPYTDHSGSDQSSRFAIAIGANLPKARMLADQIFQDLDEEARGLSWLRGVSKRQQILIGDYLYQCTSSIETNMVDSRLHFFELLDARSRLDERVSRAVTVSEGRIQIGLPGSNAPIDDLPRHLEDMHTCGFFRSIGSALDCLAGAIVGVLGLPLSLRRADIGKVQRALEALKPDTAPSFQLEFGEHFVDASTNGGPQDWVQWTTQYRNMLVHRGRRLTFHQLIPRDSRLVDMHGGQIISSHAVTHLAKSPDESDAEALCTFEGIPVLGEDAETTVGGIFHASCGLIESTCDRLLAVLQIRRDDPEAHQQSEKQWSDVPQSNAFAGFAPDSVEVNPTHLHVNPRFVHRLRAAALDDTSRHLWEEFG